MRFSRTTRILAAIAAVLLALALLDRGAGDRVATLPTLPAVNRDEVTRITLTQAGQKTILAREDDRWRILQPLQADADEASVKAILAAFRKEVPMDLRVDGGDHETYGVDDSAGITFELFTSGAEPVIAFTIGNDVAGGSTLLRLAGSSDVYRARIGGRFHYDKPATGWRNHMVLDQEPTTVEALAFTRGGQTLSFRRPPKGLESQEGDPGFGPWILENAPSFPVDQATLDDLARSLALLRASEIHAAEHGAGWENPAGTVEVTLTDGTTHNLTFVSDQDQAALVRVDDRPDVYRVAITHLKRVTEPLAAFRDRTLFDLRKSDLDAITLVAGPNRVRLKQDLGTSFWKIVEPVNADTDVRQAIWTANTLATLRADRVEEGMTRARAGLDTPQLRFVLELLDGTQRGLDVGAGFNDAAGTAWRYVARDGDPTVFSVKEAVLVQLRKAFLQS